ncbi:MAG: nuclear transport factor 2 family protein [Solirubrobacterales bacterium]
MASENVEIFQRASEALRADDVDAFLTDVAPDVEWHSLILEIEGVFHGHDGVREWWTALRAVFPDWHPTILDAEDLGDHVLAQGRGMARGPASGKQVDDDFWQIARFRDGKVAWYQAARSRSDALEAAGLEE